MVEGLLGRDMGVNDSRHSKVSNMKDAVENARLIGFNDSGEACVWYGGYGFNVYDAARDWSEITHFSSGELASIGDRTLQEAYGIAQKRMKAEGFEVVR